MSLSAPPTASPLSGLRVLVVEDEAMVAMLLEDMLAELDLRVAAVAGSVAQALAVLVSERPAFDLALLDVNLRGSTVYPVADRLLALGIPFAFCSGYGAAGVADAYGHLPVIGKPFDVRLLGEALVATYNGGRGPV